MGKGTSDFLAIAMIVGGAGVGLGIASLRAEHGPHTVRDRDGSHVRVQVRRGMRVEPGHISVRASRGNAPNVYRWRSMGEDRPEWAGRRRMRADMEEMRRSQLELRARIRELGEANSSFSPDGRWIIYQSDSGELTELLDGIESLDSDLGDLRFEVLHEEDDQRKRRRRRRPRRMADVPNAPRSGN